MRLDLQFFGGRGASQSKASRVSTKRKSIDLSKMTTDELNNWLNSNREDDSVYQLMSEKGLNEGSLFQNVLTGAGLNAKPTVISDEEFDKYVRDNKTQVLYRGVNGNREFTGDDFQNQTRYGDYTSTGRGIYGDGLYFTTNVVEAHNYGKSIMKMTLSKNAKVIDYQKLNNQFKKELKNNPNLHKTLLQKYDQSSGLSIYALQKGYNVIHVKGGNHGTDFYAALTRDAMIVSNKNVSNLWDEMDKVY